MLTATSRVELREISGHTSIVALIGDHDLVSRHRLREELERARLAATVIVDLTLPRLVPAILIAGLLQVLVPQEVVSRHFGRESGLRALVIASLAGVLTPGGPMVTVPLMVALANSGASMAPLVAYMTSWSLFGMQRIIAWEAPLMGWRFVAVRVVPSLAFPVVAGWLVKVFYQD